MMVGFEVTLLQTGDRSRRHFGHFGRDMRREIKRNIYSKREKERENDKKRLKQKNIVYKVINSCKNKYWMYRLLTSE